MLIFTMRLLILLLLVAPAKAEGYPDAGISNLRRTCEQRKDIPTQAMTGYCDCYVELMQKTVSWRDFLFLDSAVATKGLAALAADEKTILGKGLQVTLFCAQRATR